MYCTYVFTIVKQSFQYFERFKNIYVQNYYVLQEVVLGKCVGILRDNFAAYLANPQSPFCPICSKITWLFTLSTFINLFTACDSFHRLSLLVAMSKNEVGGQLRTVQFLPRFVSRHFIKIATCCSQLQQKCLNCFRGKMSTLKKLYIHTQSRDKPKIIHHRVETNQNQT